MAGNDLLENIGQHVSGETLIKALATLDQRSQQRQGDGRVIVQQAVKQHCGLALADAQRIVLLIEVAKGSEFLPWCDCQQHKASRKGRIFRFRMPNAE
jgi:hypothetical protein